MDAVVKKVCADCRSDVSQKKRVKDPRNNLYYCHPCWEAHIQPAQHLDAAPDEQAAESAYTCATCGGSFGGGQVYEGGGGTYVCHDCWEAQAAQPQTATLHAEPGSPCGNCGRSMGKLERLFQWEGAGVCLACFNHLKKEAQTFQEATTEGAGSSAPMVDGDLAAAATATPTYRPQLRKKRKSVMVPVLLIACVLGVIALVVHLSQSQNDAVTAHDDHVQVVKRGATEQPIPEAVLDGEPPPTPSTIVRPVLNENPVASFEAFEMDFVKRAKEVCKSESTEKVTYGWYDNDKVSINVTKTDSLVSPFLATISSTMYISVQLDASFKGAVGVGESGKYDDAALFTATFAAQKGKWVFQSVRATSNRGDHKDISTSVQPILDKTYSLMDK